MSIFLKVCQRIRFFLKRVRIARGSYIALDADIGRYTRINAISHIGPCLIGSFCAIGGRLVIRSSDHYTNYLNMQEFFQRSILQSDVSVAGKAKGQVKIGNAVWIGDSVIILPGVNVGNGAVIGAGSVVTKHIPDYAVAVGNPARVIKFRFSSEIIEIINDIQWWNWSILKLQKNKFIFDIDLSSTTEEELKECLKQIKD